MSQHDCVKNNNRLREKQRNGDNTNKVVAQLQLDKKIGRAGLGHIGK